MTQKNNKLEAIPTNVISGFLGTGKTTAILSLLKQKPASERWAILVNEFGEVGIDGAIFEGIHSQEQGVFIKEVPGGCMCCTAGLSMQIALNQLLTSAKPDRLLIEPTGLGHPNEVLQVLTAGFYKTVVDLQKTITLVDARKLSDSRYTQHPIFNQQIEVADIVLGSKSDLYDSLDTENLNRYLAPFNVSEVQLIEHGQADLNWLTGPSNWTPLNERQSSKVAMVNEDVKSQSGKSLEAASDNKDQNHGDEQGHRHNHNHDEVHSQSDGHSHEHQANSHKPAEGDLNELKVIKVENKGEGHESVGWRFTPEMQFDRPKIKAWLTSLSVLRAKGVLITTQGIYSYNISDGSVTEIELDECAESRIEIISDKIESSWEKQLFECLK